MKTFVQIVADAWEETGLSGDGPANVATATGKEKKMVGWVRQAWKDIQQYRTDWPWMQTVFSFTTSPGKKTYPLTELNLEDVESWIFQGASIYKVSDGVQGERKIASTTYEKWWNYFRIGDVVVGPPECLFTNPIDKSLNVHPEPEDEYTVTLRYQKQVQSLAENNDTPVLPSNNAWNEIIKWRALWLYAFHEGNPALLDEAEIQYDSMIQALDNNFGTPISITGSPIS